jgi:hypothetical protein
MRCTTLSAAGRRRRLVRYLGARTEQEDGMDFGNLTKKAKQMVDKRGGTDALKGDAEEVRDIVGGKGSAMDKAKAAGKALKDPGKPDANR